VRELLVISKKAVRALESNAFLRRVHDRRNAAPDNVISKQHRPDRGIPHDETNNRKIDELILRANEYVWATGGPFS
jgi:hypothetical protein